MVTALASSAGEVTSRRRHAWQQGSGHDKTCRNCGLEAINRPVPVGKRWYTTYRLGDRTVVASRVPTCGEPLIGDADPEALRELASHADYAAGVAWRAGDLEHAARLIADARALDPDRAAVWDKRERAIRGTAGTTIPLQEQVAARLFAAGITADDPGLQQLTAWNRSVHEREATP